MLATEVANRGSDLRFASGADPVRYDKTISIALAIVLTKTNTDATGTNIRGEIKAIMLYIRSQAFNACALNHDTGAILRNSFNL